MEPTGVIALAALGIAALTFIATQFAARKDGGRNQRLDLEKEIEMLKIRLKTLEGGGE